MDPKLIQACLTQAERTSVSFLAQIQEMAPEAKGISVRVTGFVFRPAESGDELEKGDVLDDCYVFAAHYLVSNHPMVRGASLESVLVFPDGVHGYEDAVAKFIEIVEKESTVPAVDEGAASL